MSDDNSGDSTPDETPAAPAPEPTPEPPAPVAAPEATETPWSGDLATVFEDEATRESVDNFLREKVQPYVTQLEQKSAPNRNATRLWEDFTNTPVETYVSVTSELFGEDTAKTIANLLNDQEDDPDVEPGEEIDSIDSSNLPPEVQEAVEFFQNTRQEQAFDQEFERVQKDYPDVEIDKNLLLPFITAADGDWDVAVATYKQFAADAKERWGVQVPKPEQVPAPPAVIGSANAAQAAPPIEKKHQSLDDAVDEFLAETRTNAPPVVGGV